MPCDNERRDTGEIGDVTWCLVTVNDVTLNKLCRATMSDVNKKIGHVIFCHATIGDVILSK